MPNTIPAAAEGLPEISRRKALSVTGSGLIAALAGVAASTIPTAALPATDESIHVKVRRLSRELANALNEWTGDIGTGWSVRIYPDSTREYPIAFVNDDAVEDGRRRAEYDATYNTPAMRLFRKWRKLYDASLKATDDAEIDCLIIKANRLEKRLVAMPIDSPVEYAAKMLAATSFGTFDLGDHEARLTADAVQLVGEA